jgi:hypothetical protein
MMLGEIKLYGVAVFLSFSRRAQLFSSVETLSTRHLGLSIMNFSV